MQKDITLVWFTGTLFQFNVETEDFSHNKINMKLYEEVVKNYPGRLTLLISVANNDEKLIYDKILKDNNINANVLYINYGYSLDEVFYSIQEQFNVTTYIDSARSRLVFLYKSRIFPNAKFIHLSQLI